MRFLGRLIPLGAAALAVAHSPDARACGGPNWDGHIYATLESANTGVPWNGASVLVNTNSLVADNSWHFAFVNHEFWYGVNGTGTYWVEAGFKTGSTCRSSTSAYSTSCSTSTPVVNAIFWADQRNGGGYHEHYPNVGWSENAWYEVKVLAAGSCAWNVYIGGAYLGQSTSNCPANARWLSAGLESTNADTGQHVGGDLADWKALTLYGVWVNGWQNQTLYSNCPADIEWTGSWSTKEELHGPF